MKNLIAAIFIVFIAACGTDPAATQADATTDTNQVAGCKSVQDKTSFCVTTTCGSEPSTTLCPGKDGKDGVDGSVGTPGLNCWDLDGSGSFNPATEDKDGDGQPTVGDCSGKDGKDGITCVQTGLDLASCEFLITCIDGTQFVGTIEGCTPAVQPECYVDSDCLAGPSKDWCDGLSWMTQVAECRQGICQPAVAVEKHYCAYGCQMTSATTAECLGPVVPQCTSDSQCSNGTAYCADGDLYYEQGLCGDAGTCYGETRFFADCTYGCVAGSSTCNSAPDQVCPVGAECDDGDPTTNYDKCNEAGVCVGHFEAPPQADCHFNSGGAGFIFSGTSPKQIQVVWVMNPGGQVDPAFSGVILAQPGMEFWNPNAKGVYFRPTDSADPQWWNKDHEQREADCKSMVVCLNVCQEQFITHLTDYNTDCECEFDGGLGPS